jgi:hypothetical protein
MPDFLAIVAPPDAQNPFIDGDGAIKDRPFLEKVTPLRVR